MNSALLLRGQGASVIGITESKLDKTVLDEEISIDGYELARSDRNRQGGGVVCYIRNDISFNVRGDFSSEIQNIVLDIFLQKTKPILLDILYRPPDQSGFLNNSQRPSTKQVVLIIRKCISLET